MNNTITLETITKRRSIRNFNRDKKIDSKTKEHLEQYIKSVTPNTMRIEWIDGGLQGVKLGTYGFINGASSFLVGVISNKKAETVREFGRVFELVVLKATELGLGTCWMAGTYSRKDFKKHIHLGENDSICIVSPLGYEAQKIRMRDKILKAITQNHKRKPWETLFFHENWSTPLTESDAGKLKEVLEMVRIGPSSSNKQPWRIVKKGDDLHLYFHKATAQKLLGIDYGINDSGIAMAHVEVAAEALGISGRWTYDEDPALAHREMQFIARWSQPLQ